MFFFTKKLMTALILPPTGALLLSIAGLLLLYRKPRLGRVEVTPPADRPRPPRAESFQRSWWSESPNLPAELEQPRYPLPMIGVDVDWPSRRHGPRPAPDR